MEYASNDPLLAEVLVAQFTWSRQPAVVEMLREQFLGSFKGAFSLDAIPNAERLSGLRNFLYFKPAELVFFDFAFGKHSMIAAYLAQLHETDFSAPLPDWDVDDFDGMSTLFVDRGLGFVLPSVGNSKTLLVSANFVWTEKEQVFSEVFTLSLI